MFGSAEDGERPAPREAIRLDAYLVALGLFDSRSRAQAALLAGEVEVDGRVRPKPGDRVFLRKPPSVRLRARPRFVSRGGEKLEGAFARWPLSVAGRVCADLGASTGGFTDCLLQHGARRVYAVDVGYGQLHPSLAQDPRVVVCDRTNARYLTPESFPDAVSFVTADLAFISLRLVLPAVSAVLAAAGGGDAVLLVKPQFEAGRADVGKRGVVRSPYVWRRVLEEVMAAARAQACTVQDAAPSPVRGPEGNVEFLLWVTRPAPGQAEPPLGANQDDASCAARAVAEAAVSVSGGEG